MGKRNHLMAKSKVLTFFIATKDSMDKVFADLKVAVLSRATAFAEISTVKQRFLVEAFLIQKIKRLSNKKAAESSGAFSFINVISTKLRSCKCGVINLTAVHFYRKRSRQ